MNEKLILKIGCLGNILSFDHIPIKILLLLALFCFLFIGWITNLQNKDNKEREQKHEEAQKKHTEYVYKMARELYFKKRKWYLLKPENGIFAVRPYTEEEALEYKHLIFGETTELSIRELGFESKISNYETFQKIQSLFNTMESQTTKTY